jgi:hypothetical protein
MSGMRKGKSITTYSGIDFYPLDASEEEILIEDISHALSMMCRGNGHLKHFYSVAQHSINCAMEARARNYSSRVQLACLLHDGSEAYLSDITRPVKHLLPRYLEIEDILQSQIYERFGLMKMTESEMEQVKEIDDAMLYYEMNHLMTGHEHVVSLQHEPFIEFQPMTTIENQFTGLFTALVDRLN